MLKDLLLEPTLGLARLRMTEIYVRITFGEDPILWLRALYALRDENMLGPDEALHFLEHLSYPVISDVADGDPVAESLMARDQELEEYEKFHGTPHPDDQRDNCGISAYEKRWRELTIDYFRRSGFGDAADLLAHAPDEFDQAAKRGREEFKRRWLLGGRTAMARIPRSGQPGPWRSTRKTTDRSPAQLLRNFVLGPTPSAPEGVFIEVKRHIQFGGDVADWIEAVEELRDDGTVSSDESMYLLQGFIDFATADVVDVNSELKDALHDLRELELEHGSWNGIDWPPPGRPAGHAALVQTCQSIFDAITVEAWGRAGAIEAAELLEQSREEFEQAAARGKEEFSRRWVGPFIRWTD
jgi:hypothetical protein